MLARGMDEGAGEKKGNVFFSEEGAWFGMEERERLGRRRDGY